MSSINFSELDNIHRIVYDSPPSFEFCNKSGCNIPDTPAMRRAFVSYQDHYLSQIESEGAQPGEPLIGYLPNLLDLVPSVPVERRRVRIATESVPRVRIATESVPRVLETKVDSVSKSVDSSDFVQFLPSDDVCAKLSKEELAYDYTFPNKSAVFDVMREWIVVVNKNEELENEGKSLLSDNFSIRNLSGKNVLLSDIPMKQYVVEKILSCTVSGNVMFPLLNGETICS